jgi:hypothetical protein
MAVAREFRSRPVSTEIHNVNIARDQRADEQQPNDEQREFHSNSYK